MFQLWKSSSEFCAMRSLVIVSLAQRMISLSHSSTTASRCKFLIFFIKYNFGLVSYLDLYTLDLYTVYFCLLACPISLGPFLLKLPLSFADRVPVRPRKSDYTVENVLTLAQCYVLS